MNEEISNESESQFFLADEIENLKNFQLSTSGGRLPVLFWAIFLATFQAIKKPTNDFASATITNLNVIIGIIANLELAGFHPLTKLPAKTLMEHDNKVLEFDHHWLVGPGEFEEWLDKQGFEFPMEVNFGSAFVHMLTETGIIKNDDLLKKSLEEYGSSNAVENKIHETNKAVTSANNDTHAQPAIKGKTFETLIAAISAYPVRFNDLHREVKLDSDIRSWLKKEFKLADRDTHILGRMVAEHFVVKIKNT